MKNTQQQGNVLFYILIAVGLMAALAYVVAHSGRGNVSTLTRERSALYASEVIEYGYVISQAVAQTRLRGYMDTEISFENDVQSGYTNPNCIENECKIFHTNGGNIHYLEPKESWLDTSRSSDSFYGRITFSGRSCTESTTCYADGLDNEDLIMFISYLDRDICLEINDKVGITNPSDDAPLDAGCSGTGSTFTGTFSEGVSLKDVAGDLDKPAGCFRHDGGCTTTPNSYHYYQVLIER
ncbi:MAG: hypothetical protein ACRBDL_10630 [Alphaproteobacteria bacterium]